MSLATDKPEFTPPKQNSGRLRAIGFAVLAHAILIAALTWGVGWKRESSNAPIQAELWSTTVQETAPAAAEPPPPLPVPPQPTVEPVKPEPPKPVAPPPKAAEPEPVVDPQIAIDKEKEKKKKLEKIKKEKALAKAKAEEEAEEKRLEELAKKKKLDAKKAAEKKANDAKEAKDAAKAEALRKANLERIKGLAGASGGPQATGTALQSTGPSAGYGGRVIARIKPNIVFTDDVLGNPVASVEVRCAPDGTILARKLIKSSGNSAWDNAVLRAIDKTEILPRDIDGRVPSSFEINFRPRD